MLTALVLSLSLSQWWSPDRCYGRDCVARTLKAGPGPGGILSGYGIHFNSGVGAESALYGNGMLCYVNSLISTYGYIGVSGINSGGVATNQRFEVAYRANLVANADYSTASTISTVQTRATRLMPYTPDFNASNLPTCSTGAANWDGTLAYTIDTGPLLCSANSKWRSVNTNEQQTLPQVWDLAVGAFGSAQTLDMTWTGRNFQGGDQCQVTPNVASAIPGAGFLLTCHLLSATQVRIRASCVAAAGCGDPPSETVFVNVTCVDGDCES